MISEFIKSICCAAPIETDDEHMSLWDFQTMYHFIRCVSCRRLLDYYDDEAQDMMDFADKTAGDPLWTWENPPTEGIGGLPSNREERKW